MPGQKTITWNEANDAKMLHALLHFGNIVLPTKVADQIAAYMGMSHTSLPLHSYQIRLSNVSWPGNNVPGRAITSHVQLAKKAMKKKLGDAGTSTLSITAGPSTPAGPSGGKKRPATAAATSTPSKKKKTVAAGGDTSEEEEEAEGSSHGDESGDESKATLKTEKSTTPPAAGPSSATGKGKAKARATRFRSSQLPVNYSKLNDPFTTMEGATGSDGENVFVDEEGDSSEDTSPSDGEFEKMELEEVV